MSIQAWTDIRQWIAEEDQFIAQKLDSITLYTGDEGKGKSLTMLARQALADKGFGLPRVHMDQEPFMQQAVTLRPGDAITMDEFDGHKRASMHGTRLKFLKFCKERRSLRLRIAIGFPHKDEFDSDLLNHRVRYWAHKETRRLLAVYDRVAETKVHADGSTETIVKWRFRGRFPIPDLSGPLVEDYEAMKEDFSRRDPDGDQQETVSVFIRDPEAAEEVLAKIRSQARSR